MFHEIILYFLFTCTEYTLRLSDSDPEIILPLEFVRRRHSFFLRLSLINVFQSPYVNDHTEKKFLQTVNQLFWRLGHGVTFWKTIMKKRWFQIESPFVHVMPGKAVKRNTRSGKHVTPLCEGPLTHCRPDSTVLCLISDHVLCVHASES